MGTPRFYVVARVVGRDCALPLWKERLVPLCQVSSTEPQGITYYWGADIDGEEPDTLWGLEGYTHAVGFFMGHPSSDVFKREMKLVDDDNLLKHVQGLASPDYDLKHYDFAGGWLTREDDPDKNSKDSHVAVHHFFCHKGKRDEAIKLLVEFAKSTRALQSDLGAAVQSCGVLKECNDPTVVTVWVRTKTLAEFATYQSLALYKKVILEDLKADGPLVAKTELHNSTAFNGHIDLEPLCEK